MTSRPKPIRSLLLALVAAVVVPLVVAIAYLIYEDSDHRIGQARANVRTLAKIVAANSSRSITANKETLDILSQRPLMRLVDGSRCDPILDDFRSLFPRFANLTTINLEGVAVCSAVPQPGGKPVNVSSTEWFRRALAEKRFLAGNPFVGPITGKWVSVLVSPIYGDGGEVRGFMGLPLDLSLYDPNIASVPLAPNTRYGIVSAAGRLIWRNQDNEKLVGKDVQNLEVVRKTLETKDGEFEGTGSDGVHRFYVAAPIPEVDWYAYVGVPSAPIYSSVVERAIINALLGIAALTGIVGLALYLARRIAEPTLGLAAAARRLKAGDTSVRAAIEGPLEVEEVASEFNEVIDGLQAAEAELRRVNDELEERVTQRTAELEAANREMEAFSYSVSHDLRAPLRAVDGYSQILLEDYFEKLDDEGKRLLGTVRSNAVRMGQLIDDILSFSRMGRHEMSAVVPVDLGKMAQEVFDELVTSDEKSTVRLHIAEAPLATGDATMLRQVLINLVSNAIKYSRPKRAAEIEFGGQANATENVYFVKDNGVGFEMQYVDKLFGVFQRLHGTNEFEGTGIGLAIAKRIIERHGGRIWAEGKVGEGATFHFTLPRTTRARDDESRQDSSMA